MRAPAAMAREILSIVAKSENSTEHLVKAHTELAHCQRQVAFFKYVYVSSIT